MKEHLGYNDKNLSHTYI